jgi:hypothetical protein
MRLESGPGCLADCATVEDLKKISDTIDGKVVAGERGLVTGGFIGERRTPSYILNWQPTPDLRIVVQGRAPSVRTLDTLILIGRTVRLRTIPRK